MAKVTVVVLGDIGRSPRMKYHCLSLAKEGYLVNIVGYQSSDPGRDLSEHSRVKFTYVKDCPDFKSRLSSGLALILKTLWQAFTLLFALILAGAPDFLLVQNPPAIPTLGVCYVFCRVTRSKFIVDWHNYGYTILSIGLGGDNTLVKVAKRYEFFFGRRSDANLCVTKAMKEDLLLQGIHSVTLYDRPPDCFNILPLKDKHELLIRLGKQHYQLVQNGLPNETVFTRLENDSVIWKENRPGLLFSSTSWTEDEDFNLLLEALQDYEDAISNGTLLPRLLVVITGKGPLKEFYKAIVEERSWRHIQVITPWLTAEDYPKIIACADLGVSLHYSSSGLDLPMKIVDMFGCGLPVTAVNFKCLGELVVHKKNGLVFDNAAELGDQLQQWFTDLTSGSEAKWKRNIKENVQFFRSLRWHENWLLQAKPLLQRS